MKRIKEKLLLVFNQILYFWKKRSDHLVIIDKFYPDIAYNWRVTEFNGILTAISNSVIQTEDRNYKGVITKKEFENKKNKMFEVYNPSFEKNRTQFLNRAIWRYNFKQKLVYFLFLEDAVRFYPYLAANKTYFSFTLYPGGGFLLNKPVIDNKIKSIVNSPYCKGVFVNGKFAQSYLTNRLGISKEKVFLATGVPLTFKPEKITAKKPDNIIRIGFSARKYMERGQDKGFDVFAQLATQLSTVENLEFICIGDFTEKDLLPEEQNTDIIFKGLVKGNDYHQELNNLDIIVSPVKSLLNDGDFDGFPTSSVVEASMLGVAMICSDPLGDNLYENEKEIIILPSEVTAYKEKLLELIEQPTLIKSIGESGKRRTNEIYHLDNTLNSKIDNLKKWLS